MESKKVLKENISKAFPDIDCASVFLGQSPKAIEIKTKINKWDLIKLTSFYIANETIKKKKRPSMEWEKIFSNGVTDKDLIPQNINSLYNLTTKATQLKKWAEDLIRHSSEEDIQMANKQARCSVSIISRETQIKTTMRYHFTPVRMAIIRKSTNNQCWRGCGEMGTLLHC